MSHILTQSMDSKQVLTIGFDDTDSPRGMCTTFLAYKIVNELKKENSEFLDFPRLVRFNPNIPWKTRGNGAVSIQIRTKNPSKIKSKIKNLVSKYSDIKNGANPGLVFYENDSIPSEFTEFSKLALWKLINRNYAKKFATKNNLEFFYHGNGQGLVGAIGAIGYKFDDHTLELLSYRKKSKFGKERKISSKNVKNMQKKTYPYTYNNFDSSKGRIMITPHGPDPVFYGIRGENIHSLLHASKILKPKEKLDGYMIFKSNQGTGDHLAHELDADDLRPYYSGTISGTVSNIPKILNGGHVLFSISSKSCNVPCAVYKPTGITFVAQNLVVGDKIRIGGGIKKATSKYPRTLNVEFIEIINLKKIHTKVNPSCNRCHKNMKSKGKNQGFQCVKCGAKSLKKDIVETTRKIQQRIYVPKISAHRHLTRPEQRFGTINKNSKFNQHDSWFHVYRN